MTARSSETTQTLWLFFLITFAFSWLFWIPQALEAQGMALPAGVSAFLNSPFNPAVFGPLVAALLLTLFKEGGKGLVRLLKRGVDLSFGKIWLLPILVLPFVAFAGGVLLAVLLGAARLDLSVLSNPPYAIVAFFVILLTGGPLQEEFGWRGYALPRLQARYNALLSGIVLGIVWWLWHLPVVFAGRFMANTLPLFGLLSIEIVLTSILMTWVYNNTGGSILAAILFHTSMNWSTWLFLPGMQTNAAIIGLTSLLLLVAVAWVVARCGPSLGRRGADDV